jgi:hypothetical protein
MSTSTYLRIVFTAYWSNANPSCEVFYLTISPMETTPTGLAKLETVILSILQVWAAHALRVIYIGCSSVQITDAEIAAADWRVIPGLDLNGTRE